MRETDQELFTLPHKQIERLHAERLLSRILPAGSFELEQRERPDFAIAIGNRVIGLEVTQPTLPTLRQDRMRRLDEISFASDRQFDSLNNGDSRISLYVEPNDISEVFDHRFDPSRFVSDLARLVQDAARSFEALPLHMDICVEHGGVWIESENAFFRLNANDYTTIPRPLSLAAFSESGSYERPFIWSGGTSWIFRERLNNRKAIIGAIERKSQKASYYRRNLHCDELWLLVHYLRFSNTSMQAGDFQNWNAKALARVASGFDRVFFAQFSDILELHRNQDRAEIVKL